MRPTERALAGSRRLAALLLLAAWVSGCAAVAPWERGRLAKPQMALDPDPQQRALREHVHTSREAGSGSAVGSGGGCGCY
jgi:hypothetical protein